MGKVLPLAIAKAVTIARMRPRINSRITFRPRRRNRRRHRPRPAGRRRRGCHMHQPIHHRDKPRSRRPAKSLRVDRPLRPTRDEVLFEVAAGPGRRMQLWPNKMPLIQSPLIPVIINGPVLATPTISITIITPGMLISMLMLPPTLSTLLRHHHHHLPIVTLPRPLPILIKLRPQPQLQRLPTLIPIPTTILLMVAWLLILRLLSRLLKVMLLLNPTPRPSAMHLKARCRRHRPRISLLTISSNTLRMPTTTRRIPTMPIPTPITSITLPPLPKLSTITTISSGHRLHRPSPLAMVRDSSVPSLRG